MRVGRVCVCRMRAAERLGVLLALLLVAPAWSQLVLFPESPEKRVSIDFVSESTFSDATATSVAGPSLTAASGPEGKETFVLYLSDWDPSGTEVWIRKITVNEQFQTTEVGKIDVATFDLQGGDPNWVNIRAMARHPDAQSVHFIGDAPNTRFEVVGAVLFDPFQYSAKYQGAVSTQGKRLMLAFPTDRTMLLSPEGSPGAYSSTATHSIEEILFSTCTLTVCLNSQLDATQSSTTTVTENARMFVWYREDDGPFPFFVTRDTNKGKLFLGTQSGTKWTAQDLLPSEFVAQHGAAFTLSASEFDGEQFLFYGLKRDEDGSVWIGVTDVADLDNKPPFRINVSNNRAIADMKFDSITGALFVLFEPLPSDMFSTIKVYDTDGLRFQLLQTAIFQRVENPHIGLFPGNALLVYGDAGQYLVAGYTYELPNFFLFAGIIALYLVVYAAILIGSVFFVRAASISTARSAPVVIQLYYVAGIRIAEWREQQMINNLEATKERIGRKRQDVAQANQGLKETEDKRRMQEQERKLEEAKRRLVEAKRKQRKNQHFRGKLPYLVEVLLKYLNQDFILEEEGLFRVSAVVTEVRALRDALLDGEEVDFSQILDPHVGAGALKLYFRENPEPLMTFELLDEWVETLTIEEDRPRYRAYQKIINKMPRGNRKVAKAVFGFLKDVTKHKDRNKMGASNLATVFAPNFWRSEFDDIGGFTPTTRICVDLIEHFDFFRW